MRNFDVTEPLRSIINAISPLIEDNGKMANAPVLIPDAVYGALSSWASGASAREVHNAMPEGWKARLNVGSQGVEVIAPDGKVHFIPNGHF